MSAVRTIRQSIFFAAALAVVACGDSNTEPPARSVAAVAVTPGNRALVVGDTFVFQGRVFDEEGNVMPSISLTWESSDDGVATISNGGAVAAVAVGTTTITARANGKVGSAQLVVSAPAVASIELTPQYPIIVEGKAFALTARAKDAAGRVVNGAAIAWSTSDSSIATVDGSGRVSAKRPGSVDITARIDNVTAVSHVLVSQIPVARVDVTPTGIMLEVGRTRQLTAIIRDSAGNVLTGRILNFTSDRPNIASVSATGLITATSPGYATILAASEGVTFGVAVTVTEADVAFDLVYHRESGGKNEILLLDPRMGGAPSTINAGTVSRQPTASANGSRIAFAVSMLELGTNKPIDDIFAVDRNGMNMKQLTTADGIEDHPAWSPTAARIAYRHIAPQGTRFDIWVMNADGSGQTNLTSDFTGVAVGAPAWSPDGQRLAFATSQLGPTGTITRIWTMNADGSNKTMLTSTTSGFDESPTWSADGQRIAFIRTFAGDADLAFVSSAGGEVTRLALPGNQSAPAWSPDGRLIAFTQADGTRSAIYTVRPDGGELALRTTTAAWGGGSEPAWIARP